MICFRQDFVRIKSSTLFWSGVNLPEKGRNMAGPEKFSDIAKQLIAPDISEGIKKGKEYTARVVASTLSAAKSIGVAVYGETILQRAEGGIWRPWTVKPGLRHFVSIRWNKGDRGY